MARKAVRKSNAKRAPRGFTTYGTYNFVDKDPVIDVLRTLITRESSNIGYPTTTVIRKCAEKSGVAYSTINEWFNGKTKRPAHATLEAVARYFGYTFNEPQHLSARALRLVRGGKAA